MRRSMLTVGAPLKVGKPDTAATQGSGQRMGYQLSNPGWEATGTGTLNRVRIKDNGSYIGYPFHIFSHNGSVFTGVSGELISSGNYAYVTHTLSLPIQAGGLLGVYFNQLSPQPYVNRLGSTGDTLWMGGYNSGVPVVGNPLPSTTANYTDSLFSAWGWVE